MSDPLLSTLCTICRINAPKYTCPRCASQTCSLACSKRHKVWSDCSGVRDPTVYKPRHQLATPAGIDHDYNFLSGIERGIERSDKHIVVEKGLVHRTELFKDWEKEDRKKEWMRRTGKNGDRKDPLAAGIYRAGVRVDKAPKGMGRATSNHTKWSYKERCILWQVEWIQDDGTKLLGKLLEKDAIGTAFTTLLEDERRSKMTTGEKKLDKKRKADEIEKDKDLERQAKKAKWEEMPKNLWLSQDRMLQDQNTTAWNMPFLSEIPSTTPVDDLTEIKAGPLGHYFYLLRPYTPVSEPHVLIPLPPAACLADLLRNRVLLEYPTVYALQHPPRRLPKEFIVEHKFLSKGQHEEVESDEDEDCSSSGTSSSGADSEPESELDDGKVE